MIEREFNRLESLLGETMLRNLLLSVLKGSNNYELARRYGLTIHDLRFLSRHSGDFAAILIEGKKQSARILDLVA